MKCKNLSVAVNYMVTTNAMLNGLLFFILLDKIYINLKSDNVASK